MLKIYDLSHRLVKITDKFKDRKYDSDVTTGERTLSVKLTDCEEIGQEWYIDDGDQEYVVKEIVSSGEQFFDLVAITNLESLETKAWKEYSVTNATITEAARLAVTGTGWRIIDSQIEKRRNAAVLKKSALGVIKDLCTAFMCEVVYDTKEKTISFVEQMGSDKGVYAMRGLNLRSLRKQGTSYDYYTRIIPYGKDDIGIESVNAGVEYVENYQYSSKIRTYIWQDQNYDDPSALKEDAIAKLADMSKPKISYQANIIDLARLSDKWKLLDYKLGDTITIKDDKTKTLEKQRIVKMTEYPESPEKNTCELSNTTLTWEELQERLRASAEIVNATIGSDGSYNGKISVSRILAFEQGIIDGETGETLSDYMGATGLSIQSLNASIVSISGELTAQSATIGQIQTNMLTADEADIKYATIENLTAQKARIDTLEAESITAEYADLHYASISNLSAVRARVDSLEANAADIKFSNIDTAQIDLAKIRDLFVSVGLIESATIKDSKITGYLDAVEVNAESITAGTLAVDRLLIRGTNKGIVYALNNFGQLVSQEVDTIDGYILTDKTITADKIVARTITANELAAGTITANEIAADTITSANIAAGAIKTAELDAGAVTAVKIAAGTITADRIDTADLYANFLYTRFLDAAQATIQDLHALSATIAGWNIGTDSIYKGNGYQASGGAYLGDNGISFSDKFWVTAAGVLTSNGKYMTINNTADTSGGGYTNSGLLLKDNGYEMGSLWTSRFLEDNTVLQGNNIVSVYGLSAARILAPKIYIENSYPASRMLVEECEVEITGSLYADVIKAGNIGDVEAASGSYKISTAGIDTYTTGPGIALKPGVWVVVGQWVFNTGESSGARNLGALLSPNSGTSGNGGYALERVFATNNSFASLVVMTVLEVTGTSKQTVYLKGASSMAYTTAAQCSIKAVRIK